MVNSQISICKSCGVSGHDKFCQACGQKLATERLSLHGILHEIFHYFTHLDKGFGYTLKQLVIHPGSMQKEYVEGVRARHQKPFSMFFLCGTISGLGYYFINLAYGNLYHRNTAGEADFFRHYFILLQAVMLPMYTLILWVLFRSSNKNYAELLVLNLYKFSLIFLVLIFINAGKLIFPDYENRYLEVAFLLLYTNITNVNFFPGRKWVIIGKTVVMLAISYATSQAVNEIVLKWFE